MWQFWHLSRPVLSPVLPPVAILAISPRAATWLMMSGSSPSVSGGPSPSRQASALGEPDGTALALGDPEGNSDTHSNAWAAPPMAATPSTQFAATSFAAMKMIADTYGSPYAYLQAILKLDAGSKEEREEMVREQNNFAAWLWNTFPEVPDQYYHHAGCIPPVLEKDMAVINPVCMHITSFGYRKECSMKPPPGREVFLQLCDRYFTDGFITNAEPGWVVQPDELSHQGLQPLPPNSDATYAQNQVAVHSLGYVKMFGRMTSLFALLVWVWKNGIDLEHEHPALWESILQIYVYHTPQDSKMDEALLNLAKSAAGSIRRGPNTMGMVVMIHNLSKHGMADYAEFTRKWNRRAGQLHQVGGKRATCLKLMYESAPMDAVEVIVAHVGKMPDGQSAWTDDNMSSKRLFPGFGFASKSKKWASRIRVTEESFMMFVGYVQNSHESMPQMARKKNDQSDHVAYAERSAACWALGQELMTITNVPLKTIMTLGLHVPIC